MLTVSPHTCDLRQATPNRCLFLATVPPISSLQVAVKVIDLLCVAPPETQLLLQQVSAMVQRTAACPPGVCCSYEGVCLRGQQLLLVMKHYSKSLAAIIAEEQQPGGCDVFPDLRTWWWHSNLGVLQLGCG